MTTMEQRNPELHRRVETLRSFGFGVDYECLYEDGWMVPTERIGQVKLPFSAEEWMSIAMYSGDNNLENIIPVVQSELLRALNNDGFMKGVDLSYTATCMADWEKSFSNDEGFTQEDFLISFTQTVDLESLIQKAKQHWRDFEPLDKLAFAWHVAGDYLVPTKEIPHAPIANKLEDALSVISSVSYMMHIAPLFSEAPHVESQRHADRALEIHRLVPALKTVLAEIQKRHPRPAQGFALVDMNVGPEAVASSNGYCFYYTRDAAESMYKEWLRAAKFYGLDLPRLGIRSVRISIEHGFEFLDDGPQPVI